MLLVATSLLLLGFISCSKDDLNSNQKLDIYLTDGPGDFDLGRSIVYANRVYYLNPVLRPFCNTKFGEVEGWVLPLAAQATVKVYNITDTAVAIPNPDGRFKVRGLTPGSYSVLIDGTSPYIDTTLANVNVAAGRDNRLREITLRQ